MFKKTHLSVRHKSAPYNISCHVNLSLHRTLRTFVATFLDAAFQKRLDSLDTGQGLLMDSFEFDNEIFGFLKVGDSLISWGSDAFWERPCSVELGSYYKAAEHVKMFINITYLNSGNCIFIICHSSVFPCRDAIVMSSEQNCISVGCLS